MPDNASLAEQLQVKSHALSDTLPIESLCSAHRTRMTLHANFIQRRPGQYSMKFLAQRFPLLGLDIIAQQNSAIGWSYFGTDGLGSTRFITNP